MSGGPRERGPGRHLDGIAEAGRFDDVAGYEDLSDDGQRLFDAALAGDPTGAHGPQASSGEHTRVDYVVYEGTHYRLLVVVADIPDIRLYAEPARSDGR